MESIVIGADHAGFALKETLIAYLRERDISVEDVGCYNEERVDYPKIAEKVIHTMQSQGHARAIICCGSGVGVSIAANRFPSVRAVLANDLFSAKMSRAHNDSNVICMGGRVLGPGLAIEILETWLTTSFEGDRHQKRVEMLEQLDTKKETTQPC